MKLQNIYTRRVDNAEERRLMVYELKRFRLSQQECEKTAYHRPPSQESQNIRRSQVTVSEPVCP